MVGVGLIVVLGKQGAGKGTQCPRLAERYGVPHIATGDMLRSAVRSGSELGQKVRKLMDEGHLVPDEVISEVVAHRLIQPDCARGAILDGYPRTETQAHTLDELAGASGITRCIVLDVPTPIVVARLSARRVCASCGTVYSADPMPGPSVCTVCGGKVIQRADDTAEAISERLAAYERETKPLLDHYQMRGLLTHVDGQGTLDEVSARLVAVIDGKIHA
jgi:adenylate kinase